VCPRHHRRVGLTARKADRSSGTDILDTPRSDSDVAWIKDGTRIKFGGKSNGFATTGLARRRADRRVHFDTVPLLLQEFRSIQNRRAGTDDVRFSNGYYGLYIEDGMASARICASPGLRYEYVEPTTETREESPYSPIRAATPKTRWQLLQHDDNNFAPRVASVGSQATATPIRAGFGVYTCCRSRTDENRTNASLLRGRHHQLPASQRLSTGGLALITPSSLRASYV